MIYAIYRCINVNLLPTPKLSCIFSAVVDGVIGASWAYPSPIFLLPVVAIWATRDIVKGNVIVQVEVKALDRLVNKRASRGRGETEEDVNRASDKEGGEPGCLVYLIVSAVITPIEKVWLTPVDEVTDEDFRVDGVNESWQIEWHDDE